MAKKTNAVTTTNTLNALVQQAAAATVQAAQATASIKPKAALGARTVNVSVAQAAGLPIDGNMGVDVIKLNRTALHHTNAGNTAIVDVCNAILANNGAPWTTINSMVQNGVMSSKAKSFAGGVTVANFVAYLFKRGVLHTMA